jgi:excisionase family DNA binding protein
MEQANSIDGISKRLLVSKKTVRREIETGNLKAHRIRRQLRVFESDLQDYLARQRSRPLADSDREHSGTAAGAMVGV